MTGARPRLKAAALWIAILALVAVLAVAGGHNGARGPALDPTSTSPAGAKALALLVGRLGAEVAVDETPPAPGTGGTALVLADRLDPAGDRRLVDWIRSGGVLVAADPRLVTAFTAPGRRPGAGGLVLASPSTSLAPGCPSPAVAGVDRIQPGDGLGLRVPPGQTGCFAVADTSYFMVVGPLGQGAVVLLGGPGIWSNGRLGVADNSVLAANLLAPSPGRTLHWIVGPRAGSGHKSLLQLIPGRVKEGLLELVVAAAVLCLWRARRLGRPVLESQPVELAGSELVVAVGQLLHQGHRLDDASGILRASLIRSLADQLGISPSTPPRVLTDVVAGRTGLDARLIAAALAGPAPADEAALVSEARTADHIRDRMAHVG